jgi:PAS domain S-box-containing protein
VSEHLYNVNKIRHPFLASFYPYVLAPVVTAAAIALRWLLDPLFDNHFRLIFLYGAVAFAVWHSGYGPALVVTLLGYVVSNYLFIGAPGSFDLSAEAALGFSAYLLSCSIFIGFGEAARRANIRIKQGKELLRRSERELSDFFDNAVFGIHWLDSEGKILRVNQAELDLLGYQREEYLGRQITEFYVDQSAIEDMLRRVRQGESLRDYPAEVRCKDGGTEHVSISCNALFENGRFIHSRCFTRVVTDHKEAEETRARLAAIIAASDDAIVSKSLNGIIRSWNAGAERLLGYTEAEIVGKSINTIIPPELQDEEVSIISRIRRGVRVDHFETVRLAKDGRRINLSITVSPVFDDSGRVIGASKVARDITERKQIEEAIQKADQRKDEFLATLAHELRNPLAPISNSLEILKHAEHDPELLRASCGTIERQLNHMVKLVDDLLNISRISQDKLALRRSRLELSHVVQQAVETVQPVVEKYGHSLDISLPEHSLYLDADPLRLAQIFSNLLNNACKYTPPGGHISLSAREQDGEASIAITDNGVGIAPDQLSAIFEMFVQSDSTGAGSGGGLGIGLTLAKRLVEMHGGRITVNSNGAGHGSEFVVYLPLPDQGAVEQQVPASTDSVAVGAQRVLVADDNIDNAETLATLLRINNHEVRLAHDGLAALEAAEQFRPDLLLLDIGMPKLDGYGVCRRLREQPWGKELTIAALTGWGQDEDRRKTHEAGFDAHLVKPVNYSTISYLLSEKAEEAAELPTQA